MNAQEDFEIEEINFEIKQPSKSNIVDDRDYVDKIFQDFSAAGRIAKSIEMFTCADNDEPSISGEITLIKNYKPIKTRGRKTPLAGNDIIHIEMPTGAFRLPLNGIEKFAKYLLAIAKTIECNENSSSDDVKKSHL